MSRSYWLPAIALGLIALCGSVQGKPVDQHTNKRPSTEEGRSQPESDTKPSDLASIQHQIERVARALEATNAEKPPRDDSGQRGANAEEWGSKWALGMLIVAGLETAITLLGVFLVWQTLQAARADGAQNKRAAEAAEATVSVTKEVGAAQLRPYIVYDSTKISTLTAPSTKSGITKSLELDISFRNCGLTPGVITATSGALYAPGGKGEWRGAGSSWRPVRVVIGPNQTEKIRYAGISADENDKFSWFTIGILICYESLPGPTFEEYVWLTFDGAGMRQDYSSQGFSLYRPSES